MSWVSFLSPWWALMALIALPIILLYVLRQKRPDLKVSSTLLWSRTLADMRASTPFQKLRRHLLLLLQLLILAALVLTLMRPVVQAAAPQTQAGVIVLDATASMQTHDGGADETRLDRAKTEAKALVERMRPGDRYMLIADGGGMGQVRSGFSASKSELKGLIDSVKPSDTPSDLSESLLLAVTSLRAIGAAGKSENTQPGQVWLFSDGAGIRLPDQSAGHQGGTLNFVQIGSSDHSVGITRLSITPVPRREGTYEVFVGLSNAWPIEKRVGVTLAFGSKDSFLPHQAKFVTLQANGTGGVVFEGVTVPPGKLFARADDTDDDFPLDNTAYAVIEPPRKVKVTLVTSGNDFLEKMLQAAAAVGLAEGQVFAPEFYRPDLAADLFIFDGTGPLPATDRLPRADTLLVRPLVKTAPGGVADVAGFQVSHEIRNPSILRWKREDPVMQFLNLGDLQVYQALLIDRDPASVELVGAPEGPLIAYKDFGPVRRYLVGFNPLTDSNWWRLSSLIMFVQNVIEQTRHRHFVGMPQMVAAGQPARLRNPTGSAHKDARVRVTCPDGAEYELAAPEGVVDFSQTDRLGFYEVAWSGTGANEKTLFAVNLLSQTESDIRPRSLATDAASNVRETTSVARVNREVWRYVALAALAILLLEWWAYHRRVG